MSVIFIFVDGVGLGKAHPDNPFTELNPKAFKYMIGERSFTAESDPIEEDDFLFKPVDARLGIEGLPQSGTGQVTLFSGVNAAKVLGRHFGPFPHSKIKYLLEKQSIFHKAGTRGYPCHFMNAYPDLFFERAEKRQRWTCTTLMARSAGVQLNGEEEVRSGEAITAEIVNRIWREQLRIDLPEISPSKAAGRIHRMTAEKQLILFEYFLTDKVGHAKDMQWARQVLDILDPFLMELIDSLEDGNSLVLSSDHGNMEDLSRKTHTLNEVPLFARGPAARYLRDAGSIADIPGGILKTLENA